MKFYPGLDDPWHAAHFDRACVSVRRLAGRRKPIDCPDVLLDSGAFTELHLHGAYRDTPAEYAREIARLCDGVIPITVAVAQDYMCEPFMLAKTGLTIPRHQALTIDRYDALLDAGPPVTVMPVLQGFAPDDYRRHVDQYGDRLADGMWVGVGSVCKRNTSPGLVLDVLNGIKRERPDLRLHGFGVKLTALRDDGVRAALFSADSMAWSYSARKQGRDAHDWREAKAFAAKVESVPARAQASLPLFS